MPKPRSQLISIADTPYYHCVSRCVRRAFLCGADPLTGQSYEHRRGWVEKRLLFLSRIFAIKVCAYAVMSNHTHLVLFIDGETAKNWTSDEVLQRWHSIHKGTMITQQYMLQGQVPNYLQPLLDATVESYRQRLMDISRFMKELNENIARQANFEDQCTGRFWEGRFKSQALLDEAALMACMAYVDLNPVRAKMTDTPEHSDHTSIKKRIHSAKQNQQPKALHPFVGNPRKNQPKGLPFKLKDYLQLVDLTGRIVRQNKRGSRDLSFTPILQRLNIPSENWLTIATQFEQHTFAAVGTETILSNYYQNAGYKRRSKIPQAKQPLA
ncbi:transposase [Marinomonas gallaica]|uniref:transposase n=1 Tax=Marinomonas gallaica TaxID=1806667 RepID=UPI003A92A126